MAKSVIGYDKELPEVPGRISWEKPTNFLVKDETADGQWRIDDSGRRPSRLLLVSKLREAVDEWRTNGYPAASEVAKRLFTYWFDEDHDVTGYRTPFRYHFCQREAIEPLIYLTEVAQVADARKLIEAYATIYATDLFSKNVEFLTTMAGQRKVRRYVAESGSVGEQDLPPENLPRYAFRMATGSGKSLVMAMAMVWSYFHKKRVPGSSLSTNFLVVAPNVIVYQRLEKDFDSNKVFYELPLIPPEWRGFFNQKVILRGDSAEPDPSGNVIVTNIQQVYESKSKEWTPANAVEVLLGKAPAKDLAAQQRSLLERLKDLHDLVVINDEAHHVHDEDLAWSHALLAIHAALPKGLSLWLDFSATPNDQGGMYYPWTVVDYPLAQAVEDRIVKAPLLVTKENDPNRPTVEPEEVTKETVCDKYGFWLQAAVQRWKEHQQVYSKLETKPVLFIMAEKNVFADAIGDYLVQTKEFGFKKDEVLVIHTDTKGEITKTDLEVARQAARDIDKPGNPVKAIVSVMMLREGWDVRNVSVVLGLRPFTAKAEILPEQVIGRGLRLMNAADIGPDRTQTLEVLGTQKLLEFLRQNLETEGVGVGTTKVDPPKPVIIEPVREKICRDITIPITKPILTRNTKKLSTLDPCAFEAIFETDTLDTGLQSRIRMEFATTETVVHESPVTYGDIPIPQVLIATVTNKTMQRVRLPGVFSELFPIVRDYIAKGCFGQSVDILSDKVRLCLCQSDLQDAIAKHLARKISKLTVEKRDLEFENAKHKLLDTRPFQWRRNLEPVPLACPKTVFNFVATYNNFERQFAQFLQNAPDVLRFASLGTTEQGDSNTQFRVDYLKPSGAIGFYYPDFVAVQHTPEGEAHWVIETKGREWPGTKDKDEAVRGWCERVTEQTDQRWRYIRVNQLQYMAMAAPGDTLAGLVARLEANAGTLGL